jgi:hypothetical protein
VCPMRGAQVRYQGLFAGAHLGVQSWPRFPSPFLGQAQPSHHTMARSCCSLQRRPSNNAVNAAVSRLELASLRGRFPGWHDVEG